MNHLGVHTQGFANHVNHSLGGKGPEVSKQMGLVQDGLTKINNGKYANEMA